MRRMAPSIMSDVTLNNLSFFSRLLLLTIIDAGIHRALSYTTKMWISDVHTPIHVSLSSAWFTSLT